VAVRAHQGVDSQKSARYLSELQCVAVCCSVLQCGVVCCSVLQCAAVCCSVLQCEIKVPTKVETLKSLLAT